MKRIGNSKEPTPKQMLAMASNLQKKFKTTTFVEIYAWYSFSGNSRVEYKVYLDLDYKPGVSFSSWPKALSFYRELMKGDDSTWKEAEVV